MKMNGSLQSQIEVVDKSTNRERLSKFRGTARVQLCNLRFDTGRVEQTHFLRPKNVNRLKRIFATEGCRRLIPEHHVAALISQKELDESIKRSNISQDALLQNTLDEPPLLLFESSNPIQILHGQHRLRAAQEFLSSGDDWWVVDLYLAGGLESAPFTYLS